MKQKETYDKARDVFRLAPNDWSTRFHSALSRKFQWTHKTGISWQKSRTARTGSWWYVTEERRFCARKKVIKDKIALVSYICICILKLIASVKKKRREKIQWNKIYFLWENNPTYIYLSLKDLNKLSLNT